MFNISLSDTLRHQLKEQGYKFIADVDVSWFEEMLVDIDRLYEIGYTTKGGEHGVGLPLVNKIIKQNDRFNCVPKIIDNFFVQLFTVKLYEEKNKQKANKQDY